MSLLEDQKKNVAGRKDRKIREMPKKTKGRS